MQGLTRKAVGSSRYNQEAGKRVHTCSCDGIPGVISSYSMYDIYIICISILCSTVIGII